MVRKDYQASTELSIHEGAPFDMIDLGGLRPSRLSNAIPSPTRRRSKMLDYLRIMLNAQKAKMDERGASAVEYGLLIAGIAALIVIIVFAFGGVLKHIFADTCTKVSVSSGGTCTS